MAIKIAKTGTLNQLAWIHLQVGQPLSNDTLFLIDNLSMSLLKRCPEIQGKRVCCSV